MRVKHEYIMVKIGGEERKQANEAKKNLTLNENTGVYQFWENKGKYEIYS